MLLDRTPNRWHKYVVSSYIVQSGSESDTYMAHDGPFDVWGQLQVTLLIFKWNAVGAFGIPDRKPIQCVLLGSVHMLEVYT